MRILIFFFFSTFAFADFTFYYNLKLYKAIPVNEINSSESFLFLNGSDSYFDFKGFKYSVSVFKDLKNLNFQCFGYYNKNNRIAIKQSDSSIFPNSYTDYIFLNPVNIDYCSDIKYKNCKFSTSGYFICNGSVICPSGQIYDSKQEKCVPKCPSGTELQDLAVKKCGGEDFIKSEMCDPNTGDVNITCKSCYEIGVGLYNYCENTFGVKPRSDAGVVCQENSDGSISINITGYTPDLCDINSTNSSDTNNSDINQTDNNSSNNVSSSDTNNSNSISSSNVSNTNNSVNKSSSQNDSNTTASNNTNKQCPDPCQIAQQIGTESRIEGTCHIITKPVYNGCVLEWYNDENGKCVPGCGDNKDTNTSAKLNDISGKLSTANATLKSINDTLNDLKDLKPNGNFNPGEGKLDSQESGLISDLKTFFSNTKNSLQNLKKSYDDVLNMIKNPKQFTLFKTTDSYSCPIVVETKHFHFAPDICKFVYPYKPLLQLFFTLVFSIAVVFYFFDVILRGNR